MDGRNSRLSYSVEYCSIAYMRMSEYKEMLTPVVGFNVRF